MTARPSRRIDTAALKRHHPIATVVARHGIALRPAGRALVGRCPFHQDRGRPNLHLYSDTDRWWCYRCNVGGDAIDFIMRREGLGFRDACAQLGGSPSPIETATHLSRPASEVARTLDPVERACLSTAVERYHRRLLREPAALAYCAARGLDGEDIARFQLGYATGDDLHAALRQESLSPHAAQRVGLLNPRGDERLAGRLVVPELRPDGPLWLIGRTLPERAAMPRYLGLPGRKPLLGLNEVDPSAEVYVTEGVFDRLTLARWGFPALALAGTHARPDTLAFLTRFPRVRLLMDADAAGRDATAALRAALGPRASSVVLPGVKDVADLGRRADGASIFRQAVARADALGDALAA